jgi:transcriptional regulator with XRE-family HTH domain
MNPAQCRMARAALEWSTQRLAEAAEVGVNTVNRFETGQDAKLSSVGKIQRTLESAGVIFVAENGEGAGVRLRKGVKPAAASPASSQQLSTEGKAKRVRARSKAEAVVDAALDKVDATDDEKAFRKRRLTKAPRGLRDK